MIKSGVQPKAGDKVYCVCMKKTLALFQIGTEPLENGLKILGAHIDTCRLDLKQNPLYEDSGLAYLDTHYYGGIKKYQWVTLPLAMHGVVVKKDGRVVEIVIGEDANDLKTSSGSIGLQVHYLAVSVLAFSLRGDAGVNDCFLTHTTPISSISFIILLVSCRA